MTPLLDTLSSRYMNGTSPQMQMVLAGITQYEVNKDDPEYQEYLELDRKRASLVAQVQELEAHIRLYGVGMPINSREDVNGRIRNLRDELSIVVPRLETLQKQYA